MHNILEEERRHFEREPLSYQVLAQSQGNLSRRGKPPLPPRDPRTQLSSSDLLEGLKSPFTQGRSTPPKRILVPPPVVPSGPKRAQFKNRSSSLSSNSSSLTDAPNISSKAPSVAFKVAPYVEDFSSSSSQCSSVYADQGEVPLPPRVAFHIAPYRDTDKMLRDHPPIAEQRSTDSDMYQIPDRAPSLHNLVQREKSRASKYPLPRRQISSPTDQPPPLPAYPPPPRPPQFKTPKPLTPSSKHMAQSLFNLDETPTGGNGRGRMSPPHPMNSAKSVADLLSGRPSRLSLYKPSEIWISWWVVNFAWYGTISW